MGSLIEPRALLASQDPSSWDPIVFTSQYWDYRLCHRAFYMDAKDPNPGCQALYSLRYLPSPQRWFLISKSYLNLESALEIVAFTRQTYFICGQMEVSKLSKERRSEYLSTDWV